MYMFGSWQGTQLALCLVRHVPEMPPCGDTSGATRWVKNKLHKSVSTKQDQPTLQKTKPSTL